MNGYNITSPKDEIDFQNYYYFRWEYLRKPLNKKLGKPYTGNPLKHELIKTIGLKKGIVEMYKNLKNEY